MWLKLIYKPWFKGKQTSLALGIFLAYVLSPSLLAQIPTASVLAQTSTNSTRREANRLLNQGNQQFQQNQFEQALTILQQALNLYQTLGDLGGQGDVLFQLGQVYEILGQYEQSLECYRQAGAIFWKLGEQDNRAGAFSGVGIVYLRTGRYSQAIAAFQQALEIVPNAAVPLNGLGLAYSYLGQYDRALKFHQQVLAIRRANRNLVGEATSLLNMGTVYEARTQLQNALDAYQQALVIYRKVDNPTGQIRSLNLIGEVLNLQNQPAQAMSFLQDAIKLAKTINDARGQAITLNNLGRTYTTLQEYAQALDFYEQALSIRRQVGDREGEGRTLSDIGELLAKQKQPELAIVFLKESVQVYESIRQGLQKLPQEQQASYTQTVAGTYRALADLLLSQGRVLEAQQVLELLKVQELRHYTRDTRGDGEPNGALLNAIEAPVKPPFDALVALGLKLTDCENQRPRCAERDQLLSQRATAKAEFDQQATRLRRLAQQGNQDPAQLQQQELTVAAIKVVKATPKTVLIYPLVLQDKLWLVYGLQAGKDEVVFASKEIPVNRQEISNTVAQFRTLLENPNSGLKQLQQVSQQLYEWLIAPVRPQLDANGIQNLVFSLDRATRYMPLAALHDGKQYLIERFTISTILTAGLTDTVDKLSPNPDDNAVLALGLSRSVPGFNALPSVPAELDAIVRSQASDTTGIFQGSKYLDQAFTLNAFKDLIDYRILHIATHGKFESDDPEKSYLLLGNGDRLRVPDIRQLSGLASIHLAVLSACETAKGGQDKEGIEVAGLSYYFLTQNVKSVLASLWLVNDASTALIMQQFYKHLATGMSKSAALQRVQQDFIQSKLTAKDAPQGRSEIMVTSSRPRSLTNTLAHPYYWAPFILIGNGL